MVSRFRPIEIGNRQLRAPTIRGRALGSPSTAGMFGRAAQDLGALGGYLLEQGVRRAEEEQLTAGAEVGLEQGRAGQAFQTPDPGMFESRAETAFRKGAARAYKLGLDYRIENRRQELELAHEADPDGFAQAWQEYAGEVMQLAPPDLRADVQLSLMGQAQSANLALAKQRAGRIANEAAFDLRLRTDQLAQLAATSARQAGDPVAAIRHLDELDAAVRGAVEDGLIEDGTAAAILIGGRDTVYEQAWLGWFEQAPSRGRLAQFMLGDTEGIGPEQKDRIAAHMRGQLAQIEAEQNAAMKQLASDVGTAVDALSRGIAVQGLPELRQRAAGTELEGTLATVEALAGRQAALARLRPDELSAEITALDGAIEELRTSGVALDEADQAVFQLSGLEALEDEAKRRLAELDATRNMLAATEAETAGMVGKGLAVERAAQLGLVELAPIDFTDQETLTESLAARAAAADVAEGHFGIAEGNPLTAGELEGFKALMQAGPAETPAQMAALSAMQQAWGEQRTRAVLEQTAKDAPLMAAAGSLLLDQPHVGQEIIRGRAVLAENPKLAPTRENLDARAAVNAVYGDAFAGPASLALAEDAARALYASRKFAEGDLSGELDIDAFEQALHDVVGGVLEWENDAGLLWGDVSSRVFPPRPNMTDNQFADLMDALRDEDLALAGALPVDQQGNPISAEVLKRTAKLTNFARGQYLVTIGGFAALRADGAGPYVLDLEQVLRAQGQ